MVLKHGSQVAHCATCLQQITTCLYCLCNWLHIQSPDLLFLWSDTLDSGMTLCASCASQALTQPCGVYCQLTVEWTVACWVSPHSAMLRARESRATAGSISMKWHSWQPRDIASRPTAPAHFSRLTKAHSSCTLFQTHKSTQLLYTFPDSQKHSLDRA